MFDGEYLTSDGYALAVVADLGTSSIRMGYNIYPQPRFCFPPLPSSSQGILATNFLEGAFTSDLLRQDVVDDSLIDDCLAISTFINSAESKCSLVYGENKKPEKSVHLPLKVNYCPPLVVVPPRHYSKDKKCELLSLLFSETSHESIAFVQSPPAQLFSIGKSSGIVLESGASLTACTPVCEGYSLSQRVQTLSFGGHDTSGLMKLVYPELTQSSNLFISINDRYQDSHNGNAHQKLRYLEDIYLRKLKRNISEVGCNLEGFENALHKNAQTKQQLPDGSTLTIGLEKFLLTEPLMIKNIHQHRYFEMMGKDLHTSHPVTSIDHTLFNKIHIPSLIHDTCSTLDHHIFERVRHTIMTCGGGISFIRNLNQRLKNELSTFDSPDSRQLAPVKSYHTTSFVDSSSGLDSAWVGSSILSSVPGFSDLYISRKDIEEQGAERVILTKCP